MEHDTRQVRAMRDLPYVNAGECAGCGNCAKVCFRRAVSFTEKDKADIFQKRCAGIDSCGRCVNACPNNAIRVRG
jgi:MinD superfamily P-loop ATPase